MFARHVLTWLFHFYGQRRGIVHFEVDLRLVRVEAVYIDLLVQNEGLVNALDERFHPQQVENVEIQFLVNVQVAHCLKKHKQSRVAHFRANLRVYELNPVQPELFQADLQMQDLKGNIGKAIAVDLKNGDFLKFEEFFGQNVDMVAWNIEVLQLVPEDSEVVGQLGEEIVGDGELFDFGGGSEGLWDVLEQVVVHPQNDEFVEQVEAQRELRDLIVGDIQNLNIFGLVG